MSRKLTLFTLLLAFFGSFAAQAAPNFCMNAFFDSDPLIKSGDLKTEFAKWRDELVELEAHTRTLTPAELQFVRTAFGYPRLDDAQTTELYRIQRSKLNVMMRNSLEKAFERKLKLLLQLLQKKFWQKSILSQARSQIAHRMIPRRHPSVNSPAEQRNSTRRLTRTARQ